MSLRWRLALAVLVAAICLAVGFEGRTWFGKREVSAHEQKAAQVEAVATQDHAQGVAHDQEAAQRVPVLAADDAEVQRLEAEQPAPPAPPASNLPGSDVVGPAPVVLADPKDLLLAALKQDLADTKAQLDTVTLARDAYKAEAAAKTQEIVQLRGAIAAAPKDLHWAAGPVYGTNQALGAGVEYDLGPFRAEVDVVRVPLAGGQSSIQAIGSVKVRF